MSSPLVPVITNAGLAACVAASGNGLALSLTQLGVGQGVLTNNVGSGYAPDAMQTALKSEVLRVPFLSGATLGQNAFRVEGVVPYQSAPTNYVVWELGFYTSAGVLFAVWSSPQFPLAAKTGLADIELAFDLFLQQLPPGSIAITVGAPSIVETAGVLAELLAGQASLFTEALRMKQRLFAHLA